MTFEDPINRLPTLQFLQNIFNYASPIFVGSETLKLFPLSTEPNKWKHVLETTRILLAHCSLMEENKHILLEIVSNNIRNLYRLIGIDL
jgi:hypothetical protein